MTQDRFTKLVSDEFLGNTSAADAAELASMLTGSRSLQKRYSLLKEYLINSGFEEQLDHRLFEKVLDKINSREPQSILKRKRIPLAMRWAVAATVLLTLSVTLYFISKNNLIHHAVVESVQTLKAKKRHFTLSDGTYIVLNADSKLIFPSEFNGNIREVTLSGEAYFRVHHDPAHPFVIHTGKMDVRVLGTEFNLKAYPGDNSNETTLLRGKVQITLKDRPSDVITLNPTEKLIVRFTESQNKEIGGHVEKHISLPEVTHMQQRDSTVLETSWIKHKVMFKDKNFGELSKDLERAYNVEITFENEELKQEVFSGTFDQQNIRDVLNALQLIAPFKYHIDNNQITIQ
jgi:transmembrane sensor